MVSCVTALTRRYSPLWVGLITAIGVVLTVACSSGGSSEPVVVLEQISPAEIISRSSDALSDTTTFRFALSHDHGNTILTNGIEVTTYIPGVGHNPHEEVPEIVNAELIRFLGSDAHEPAGRGGR